MLCAKYSYKDDIAVKQEEARNDGIAIGIQQKAVETAINMLKREYPVKDISEITNLPAEKILELQKQSGSKV